MVTSRDIFDRVTHPFNPAYLGHWRSHRLYLHQEQRLGVRVEGTDLRRKIEWAQPGRQKRITNFFGLREGLFMVDPNGAG